MTRLFTVTLAIMVVLAVSVVVSPPPDGRLDGRGVLAILAGIGTVAVGWHLDRARVTK